MARVLRISRQEVLKRTQISGLHLMSEAVSVIQNELVTAFPPFASIDEFIKLFIDILVKDYKLNSILVDKQIAQQVIDEIRERRITSGTGNELVVKNVVKSEDNVKKTYLKHLSLLRQHLEKHPIFQSREFTLSPIDNLITLDKDLEVECIVYGFLYKDKTKIDSEFYIEDNTGKVPIVFSEDTQFKDDLIPSNSFVLVEGSYDSAKDTLFADSVGHTSPANLQENIDLSNSLERVGRMVVVVSDIHLDDKQTLDKLKTMLTGYDSMVPIPDLFIFVGPFVSQTCQDITIFKNHMKNLVKLIAKFNKISRLSQFIFVPGFHDNEGNDLPKPAFTVDMFPTSTTKLANYHLATNPVNIYIDNRHICLAAFPYMSRLEQNIINDNCDDTQQLGSSIIKLISSNGHLSSGLSRHYESCLSVFHIPDFIILFDSDMNEAMDSKAYDYSHLLVLPSFSSQQFKFKVFYTEPKHHDSSQILS
ncbi:DNA polymerase epsilon subunit 2-like [Oppia nitens]|uniref:DNA polymerase epsilon subunit 2-like n=1 Tax=Oppia nitens TaxID=1686743 RepID=UPI0023DA9A16|nr:DNA polymerase epsilon subunit 2-like [Oppia nitens]